MARRGSSVRGNGAPLNQTIKSSSIPLNRTPFLQMVTVFHKHGVSSVVGVQVGNMVPLVGGPAHAPVLMPLLEALAKEEETVVRDAAVKSLSKVGATFSRTQAMEHLVPCIRVRLTFCYILNWTCFSWCMVSVHV
jgi:hypothetical protein